jgi:hypothetical protein
VRETRSEASARQQSAAHSHVARTRGNRCSAESSSSRIQRAAAHHQHQSLSLEDSDDDDQQHAHSRSIAMSAPLSASCRASRVG